MPERAMAERLTNTWVPLVEVVTSYGSGDGPGDDGLGTPNGDHDEAYGGG